MLPGITQAPLAGGYVGARLYDYLTEEDEDALAQTVEPTPPEGYKTEKSAAEVLAEPVEDENADTLDAAEAPPPNSDVIISDGAWKYQVLGGGKIKFVGVPPGSEMMGKTLDPEIIKQMPPGPARDRLQRSYDSIKSFAQTGKPLMRLPSKPKAAPAPAPDAPTPPAAPPPAAETAAPPTPAPVEAPTNKRMSNWQSLLERLRNVDSPNYWENE